MSAPAQLRFSNDELDAQTPVEFRQLLEKIRVASGLSCGQISVKTKIPRSQTYNLVSSSRTTLPRRPEQVKAFVTACNLPEMQVENVMQVWRRLDRQSPRAFGSTNAAGSTKSASQSAKDSSVGEDDEEHARSEWRMREWMGRSRRSRNDGADLLFLILNSEQLTRRALQLIYPFVGAWVFTISLIGLLLWLDALGGVGASVFTFVLMSPLIFAVVFLAWLSLGRSSRS